MADTKISALTELADPATGDLVAVVDDPGGTPTTKKCTLANLLNGCVGATVTTAGKALLDDADSTAQRTTLGLGTIATQAANNVSITGGSLAGITDLAVADGGTGASTAATALTNLGIGPVSSNLLSADVDIPTAGTYVDGPSLSLAAGTYIVLGGVSVKGQAAAQLVRAEAKLWDGTTVWASAQQTEAAVTGVTTVAAIMLGAMITLGTTTTVKISATGSTNGQDIIAATLANPSGNNASYLYAMKIG